MDDIKPTQVLAAALRRGDWELYSDPVKGETITLRLHGNHILSIHNRLLAGEEGRPTELLTRQLTDPYTAIVAMIRLEKTERMLNEAIDTIAQLTEGSQCSTGGAPHAEQKEPSNQQDLQRQSPLSG